MVQPTPGPSESAHGHLNNLSSAVSPGKNSSSIYNRTTDERLKERQSSIEEVKTEDIQDLNNIDDGPTAFKAGHDATSDNRAMTPSQRKNQVSRTQNQSSASSKAHELSNKNAVEKSSDSRKQISTSITSSARRNRSGKLVNPPSRGGATRNRGLHNTEDPPVHMQTRNSERPFDTT